MAIEDSYEYLPPPAADLLKLPAIQTPELTSMPSVVSAILSLKERVEGLQRERGDLRNWAVTWHDLLALGIVKPTQVPQKR